MVRIPMATPSAAARTPLTPEQIRGFLASWGGWALDGMDSFIYALVLVPALKELLPLSGVTPTPANLGYYGGLLFALFLIGWGFAALWGPIGDRFGRVRTLMLTILCYSLFTFLGAVAANVWQLAAFRLLAGVGIGGEWALGGILVAEALPEDRRKTGATLMHTGYYVGIFLAGALNYLVGAHYGWRAMFALGGAPALLVGFIRAGVHEPEKWKQRAGQARGLLRPMLDLFSPALRRRTWLNSLYLLISMTGLWAGSVYVPSSVTYLATRAGYRADDAARLASWATMLLSAATIAGCLAAAPLAERYGRRAALGLYFAVMFVSISAGFGWSYYLAANALPWFFLSLALLGFGGANFAVYTLWLPEQYPTGCRASAFAFATSAGRFVAAGVTFLVGSAVSHYQTIGTPVAWTSIAFLIGLLVLPAGVETKGQPLPE
ncbi:MAG: MFS transporter [Acidobacteria bacterium]|nr:MFS transporter [Acidobacteriota bacterium]